MSSDKGAAESYYKISLESEEGNVRVLKALYRLYLDGAKWESAEEIVAQIVKFNPLDKDLPFLKAQKLLLLGDQNGFVSILQENKDLNTKVSGYCTDLKKSISVSSAVKSMCQSLVAKRGSTP
mgnify:CR=1 FL=1